MIYDKKTISQWAKTLRNVRFAHYDSVTVTGSVTQLRLSLSYRPFRSGC